MDFFNIWRAEGKKKLFFLCEMLLCEKKCVILQSKTGRESWLVFRKCIFANSIDVNLDTSHDIVGITRKCSLVCIVLFCDILQVE